MTSPQHAEWISRGRPETIARPVAELATVLRRHGYTVGVAGDDRHLNAEPPEDHTPYSETGWPIPSPYGWVFALDVMPPPAGSHLPSLSLLAAKLIADRTAAVPGAAWIKYLNWEPQGSAGPCWCESWEPHHAQRPSTDRGHLHISGRSDCGHYTGATTYDPVAAITAAVTADPTWTKEMLMNLPVISPGASGWAVRRIQALANVIVGGTLTVDGAFGPATTSAVTLVQQRAKLHADGVVRPDTWAALLGVTL